MVKKKFFLHCYHILCFKYFNLIRKKIDGNSFIIAVNPFKPRENETSISFR